MLHGAAPKLAAYHHGLANTNVVAYLCIVLTFCKQSTNNVVQGSKFLLFLSMLVLRTQYAQETPNLSRGQLLPMWLH
jgi:hypothetical protein